MPPVPVAVLASGHGSNLQALLDATRGTAPGRVVLVVSDRKDAGALERARQAGAAAEHVPADETGAGLLALFQQHRIGLVVLAGYLRKIPPAVVAADRGKMINVHPALLPAFGGPGMYGRRVHEAVLKSGARVSGVTVHLVDEQYDHGPILMQWPVPVKHNDTPDTLAARVLAIEHLLLPAVVLACCQRRSVTFTNDAFTPSDAPPGDLTHALTTT